MSITLDEIVTSGGIAVAAIVEHSVRSCSSLPGVTFVCIKRPLVVLIRHDDGTRGYDVDGTQIDPDEIAHRYREQYAIFESHLSNDYPHPV